MKQLLITFAVFGIWAPWHLDAQTQKKKEETIVIEDNRNETIIEIKDGKVYIDGKEVSPYDLKRNLKIIRRFGNADEFDVVIDDDGTQSSISRQRGADRGIIHSGKAMLGVQTTATPNNIGAKVEVVTGNSPAELSGIVAGDIITKIDNQTISTPQDLADVIDTYKPHDKVDIVIQRGGNEKTVAVILAERNKGNNPNMSLSMPPGFSLDDFMRNFDGLDQDLGSGFSFSFPNGFGQFFSNFGSRDAIRQASPKIGAEVEERADNDGLMVTTVKQGSAAEKAGLKQGDVITTVAGQKINNVDQLSRILVDLKGKRDVVLVVKRGSKTETLYLEMPVELRKREF